jgi:hypothetical protein
VKAASSWVPTLLAIDAMMATLTMVAMIAAIATVVLDGQRQFVAISNALHCIHGFLADV